MNRAYQETWVKNVHLQNKCRKWMSKKLLTEAQFERICTEFPHQFYLPNLFVRIGLFLFASVSGSFFVSFITLLFGMESGNSFIIPSIISGIGFFASLEFMIREKKLYHSGADNALLYAGLVSFFVPLVILFENRLEVWQYCLAALILLIPAFYRYADSFVALCILTAWYTLIMSLMMKSVTGRTLLPFAMMGMSAALYVLVSKIRDIYYRQSRILLEFILLLLIYLSGNYYVVREANALINDIGGSESPQIDFAIVFYAFTLIIPALYIFLGLKQKNRILLIAGLLALAFSGFTFYYYTDFLSASQATALSGVLMIGISALCIHYLKQPRYGIADHPEEDSSAYLHIQTILASEVLSDVPAHDNFRFGGSGEFSGGGSAGEY